MLYPFSLYPSKLKERVQEHRKEHLWDAGHKPAFAAVNKQLQEFDNDVGKLKLPSQNTVFSVLAVRR